jgi:hypothetical protein
VAVALKLLAAFLFWFICKLVLSLKPMNKPKTKPPLGPLKPVPTWDWTREHQYQKLIRKYDCEEDTFGQDEKAIARLTQERTDWLTYQLANATPPRRPASWTTHLAADFFDHLGQRVRCYQWLDTEGVAQATVNFVDSNSMGAHYSAKVRFEEVVAWLDSIKL